METETLIHAEVASYGRQRERGIFEKVPGSDEWWIRYHDAESRLRREKARTHGMAVKLYQKRKMEALRGKKLPESLRKVEMPTLRGFSQRFADEISIRCKEKPNTVMFYAIKLKRLLEYDALANAALDTIAKRRGKRRTRRRSVLPPSTGNWPRFAGCFGWRTNGELSTACLESGCYAGSATASLCCLTPKSDSIWKWPLNR